MSASDSGCEQATSPRTQPVKNTDSFPIVTADRADDADDDATYLSIRMDIQGGIFLPMLLSGSGSIRPGIRLPSSMYTHIIVYQL